MAETKRRVIFVAAVACVVALSVAAAAMAAIPNAVIGSGKLQGTSIKALVNARGRTVYVYSGDSRNRSNCYGDCLSGYYNWQPVLTGGKVFARSGSGVNQKLLGVTRRHGGKLQVTYNHHPLYTYSADSGPGQWYGQRCPAGTSGHFAIIRPSGKPDKQDINICQAY